MNLVIEKEPTPETTALLLRRPLNTTKTVYSIRVGQAVSQSISRTWEGGGLRSVGLLCYCYGLCHCYGSFSMDVKKSKGESCSLLQIPSSHVCTTWNHLWPCKRFPSMTQICMDSMIVDGWGVQYGVDG